MKKTQPNLAIIAWNIALMAFLLVTGSFKADGQTYGSTTTTTTTNFLVFTGTTNSYAYTSAGTPASNSFTIYPSSEYIVLTNIVSTNETFVGGVYVQVPVNLLTNCAGFSNLIYVGSISYGFSNGLPSGGIWSTNTVPVSGTLTFPTVFQAANGIYTNGIYCKP